MEILGTPNEEFMERITSESVRNYLLVQEHFFECRTQIDTSLLPLQNWTYLNIYRFYLKTFEKSNN